MDSESRSLGGLPACVVGRMLTYLGARGVAATLATSRWFDNAVTFVDEVRLEDGDDAYFAEPFLKKFRGARLMDVGSCCDDARCFEALVLWLCRGLGREWTCLHCEVSFADPRTVAALQTLTRALEAGAALRRVQDVAFYCHWPGLAWQETTDEGRAALRRLSLALPTPAASARAALHLGDVATFTALLPSLSLLEDDSVVVVGNDNVHQERRRRADRRDRTFSEYAAPLPVVAATVARCAPLLSADSLKAARALLSRARTGDLPHDASPDLSRFLARLTRVLPTGGTPPAAFPSSSSTPRPSHIVPLLYPR